MKKVEHGENIPLFQRAVDLWPGGYFGFPGRWAQRAEIGDGIRSIWRKEYLPGATELLAKVFCASIAGAIATRHQPLGRLRVTLHRVVSFGNTEFLQQACDYQGAGPLGTTGSAGRTFPAENGTIGRAYACRRIVRSRRGVKARDLKAAMEFLSLNEASRTMSSDVCFVLAIPLLQPEVSGGFYGPAPVIGTIYVDCNATQFYIDDGELAGLLRMADGFLNCLRSAEVSAFSRIRNVPLRDIGRPVPRASALQDNVIRQLELVKIDAPRSSEPLQLNYDYSDFVPVQGVS
jgi:hypothetical protein